MVQTVAENTRWSGRAHEDEYLRQTLADGQPAWLSINILGPLRVRRGNVVIGPHELAVASRPEDPAILNSMLDDILDIDAALKYLIDRRLVRLESDQTVAIREIDQDYYQATEISNLESRKHSAQH